MAKKKKFNSKKPNWSYVEYEFLIENFNLLSVKDLSEYLLKSEDDIEHQINLLALRGKTNKKGPVPTGWSIRICEQCRAAFLISPYELQRRPTSGKFCSNICTSISKKIKTPSKKVLQTDYKKGLSTNDIAEKYQISKGTVYNLFKKYQINTRSFSESLEIFFTQDKGKKAILKRLYTLQDRYGTVAPGYNNKKLKSGFKEDLGVSVRSGWESNVLRWLTYLGKKWEFEPKTFFFPNQKKAPVAYLPDIYLPDDDIWIEVKGRFRNQDRSKMKKMKKYYPDEFSKLHCIIQKPQGEVFEWFIKNNIPVYAFYNDIQKQYAKLLPHWE